jgi:hypothetical protein
MFLGGSQTVSVLTAYTHASVIYSLIYTDPGSGTLIWQLLLAAFFGVAFYFRRFKDMLLRRKAARQPAIAEPDKEQTKLAA